MRQAIGTGIAAVAGILLAIFLWQFLLPELQEMIYEWFICVVVPLFWIGLTGFTIFLCCYFIYQAIIIFREKYQKKNLTK